MLMQKLTRLAEPLAADGGAYDRFLAGLGEKLLTDRAELLGLSAADLWSRREPVSVGGACRILPSSDGVVAVNLPRDCDWDMVEAWLSLASGEHVGAVAGWDALSAWVAKCTSVRLQASAAELGLAVCEAAGFCGYSHTLWEAEPMGSAGGRTSKRRRMQHDGSLASAKIVDMSSMWAGPLCGNLLAQLGADVVKVESAARPDGIRLGQPEFYAKLNSGKDDCAVDLATTAGRNRLMELLLGADVVISSCRVRALEQLGLDPVEVVAQSGGIWVGITGYGLLGGQPERVAFGDDAAAAGGLVWPAECTTDDTAKNISSDASGLPCFVGDAIADPATGAFAAAGVLERWSGTGKSGAGKSGSGGVVLDIPMAGVARWLAHSASDHAHEAV